jgi:hypothetical protein
MSKQRSREAGEDGGTSSVGEDPENKKPKLDDGLLEVKQEDLYTAGSLTSGSVPDSTGSWGEVRTLRIWFNYSHQKEEIGVLSECLRTEVSQQKFLCYLILECSKVLVFPVVGSLTW